MAAPAKSKDELLIDAAEAEAKRFLSRVAELRKAVKNYPHPEYLHRRQPQPCDCPKQNAAMKRASMDLTRALVPLRRSNVA